MKIKCFEFSIDGATTTFVAHENKNFGTEQDLRSAITRLANNVQVNDEPIFLFEPQLSDYPTEQLRQELISRFRGALT